MLVKLLKLVQKEKSSMSLNIRIQKGYSALYHVLTNEEVNYPPLTGHHQIYSHHLKGAHLRHDVSTQWSSVITCTQKKLPCQTIIKYIAGYKMNARKNYKHHLIR